MWKKFKTINKSKKLGINCNCWLGSFTNFGIWRKNLEFGNYFKYVRIFTGFLVQKVISTWRIFRINVFVQNSFTEFEIPEKNTKKRSQSRKQALKKFNENFKKQQKLKKQLQQGQNSPTKKPEKPRKWRPFYFCSVFLVQFWLSTF